MSKRAQLVAQRDELLAKIRTIETNCEGEGENRNSGIARILKGIKTQRWFFIKNKPKVLLDRNTGLLWANLKFFPYQELGGSDYGDYAPSDVPAVISGYDFDGIDGFRVPSPYELWDMIADKTFPFQEGNYCRILNRGVWAVFYNGSIQGKHLDDAGATADIYKLYTVWLLPCSDALVLGTDYADNVSRNNSVHTEAERLQFTLNLFVEHGLEPIFKDEAVTQLYKQIYFEKPPLVQALAEVQAEVDALEAAEREAQKVVLLSSTFDAQDIVAQYDSTRIDGSYIAHFQAVKSVVDDFQAKLRHYTELNASTIHDFDLIGLKLHRKYQASPDLTAEENQLLAQRQSLFKRQFALGMEQVSHQLLAIKAQAESMENRLDEIHRGEQALASLAQLEAEPRVSFAFLVENIAHIIRNALLKIEFFQENPAFVQAAVDAWQSWEDDYKIFKTTRHDTLAHSCAEDGIENEVWEAWYADWQSTRLSIEALLSPLVAYALQGHLLAPLGEEQTPAVVALLHILADYKTAVDTFYLEEQKGIYQKFVFQAGGDLQIKFESQSELHKLLSHFQQAVTNLMFDLSLPEERLFLLHWAEGILDMPVQELLDFVAERDLDSISAEILKQFAALRGQNFAVFRSDSKAYATAVKEREKEFTALVFKMRKDLQKA